MERQVCLFFMATPQVCVGGGYGCRVKASCVFSRNVRFHESVFPFLDGSLLWDADVMRGTWRFPLYRHLTPFGSSRHTNLRINPDTMPSPRDPVNRSANDLPPYSFVRPMSQPVATAQRIRTGQADPAQLRLPTQSPESQGGVPQPRLTVPNTDRVAEVQGTSPAIPQTWTRNSVPGPVGATTLEQLTQQDVALTVDPNHVKRGQSGDRFRSYREATTISQLRERGATDADIRHDLRRGIITLRDAALSEAFSTFMLDSHAQLEFGEVCNPHWSSSDDSGDDEDSAYDPQPTAALTDAYLDWRLDSPPSLRIVEALAGLSNQPICMYAALKAKGGKKRSLQSEPVLPPDDGMSVNECQLSHQVDPCDGDPESAPSPVAFAAYISDVPEAWPMYLPLAVQQHGAAAMYTGVRPNVIGPETSEAEPADVASGVGTDPQAPALDEPDVTVSLLFARLDQRRNGLRSILIQFVRNQLGWIEGELDAPEAINPMRVVTRYIKRSLGEQCSDELAAAAVQWCRTAEAESFIDPNGPILPNDNIESTDHPSESYA